MQTHTVWAFTSFARTLSTCKRRLRVLLTKGVGSNGVKNRTVVILRVHFNANGNEALVRKLEDLAGKPLVETFEITAFKLMTLIKDLHLTYHTIFRLRHYIVRAFTAVPISLCLRPNNGCHFALYQD